MCFYSANAMAKLLSASSSAYCKRVVMNRDVSSPINFEATMSLTVNSYRIRFMTRRSMPTIEQNCPISQRGSESEA